jgi:hypothetical protein
VIDESHVEEQRSSRGICAPELHREGTSEVIAEIAAGRKLMEELQAAVNLTEAPEDAVCSLLVDLMHYCERERIDWPNGVMPRARACFSAERRLSRGR